MLKFRIYYIAIDVTDIPNISSIDMEIIHRLGFQFFGVCKSQSFSQNTTTF